MTGPRPLDPWDRALLEALHPATDLVTLDELAVRTKIPPTLLEVVVREGFLKPVSSVPEPLFDPGDVEPIKAGLSLVEAGLPLGELLDLARKMDAAMQPVVDQAIDLFVRFIRDSVEANAGSDEEAARRLVEAFSAMLPATGRIVDHHFRSLVLEGARQRLEQ
ncbi:MAG TPA: hypothetical protein VFZ06_04935 [Acidimicrobiia bacterium]|nr:hypothetical protein [Acidimicrobiia bacterium]